MIGDERIILGIDPGTNIMGYGIIKSVKKETQLIAIGVIELSKLGDHYAKLHHIFERTLSLIDQFKPDELAIEAPFYGKNVQSMLKLGRAQGAAIAAALCRAMPIFEYPPRKIKMAITGNGAASKEQVAGFLKNIYQIAELPTQLDATDGLAAALCHHFQKSSTLPAGKYKDWKQFIKDNPQRLG